MIVKKPPVVVILGHVDHGKTTLLDQIRKTKIALKEAGGITQKIGAYEIEFNKEKITFIDTPGHFAFNKLRERGAKVADIGILVIAADEGIKPQTKESFEILKSFKLPFIVALNKIDKKEANPEKVLSEIMELGIIPEKFGGEVPVVYLSAKTGQGVDELLETILVLRDIYDLKTETEKPGQGFILEIFKDTKRGILASVIVNEGQIKEGDYLIIANSFCKIRILEDDLGNKIKIALPSKPALVGNFDKTPYVGSLFEIGDLENLEEIQKRLKEKEEIFFSQSTLTEEKADASLILKADNFGSLEALENILNNLNIDKKIKILKKDIGPLTFNDLELAKNFNAFLISFNLKNSKDILEEIKKQNLVLIEDNVVYRIEEKLLDYFKKEKEESLLRGKLEILAVFNQTKSKKTIGGKVTKGKIRLNQKVKILRNSEVIGKGKIISLEKNKVAAEEVEENNFCGLIIQTESEIKVGDFLQLE